MGEILIIGNGFDLAHKLPTKYDDYLFLVKNIEKFEREKDLKIAGQAYDSTFDKYLGNKVINNIDALNKFIEIIKNNAWVNYFSKCEAEIKGWIDFENEIVPICNSFDRLFKADFRVFNSIRSDDEDVYPVMIDSWRDMMNLILWNNIIQETYSGNIIYLKEKFGNVKQGILQERILDELRKTFSEFKQSMILYMDIFIDDNIISKSSQIQLLKPERIISFNYTETEKNYYTIKAENICHVHGDVSSNQIVLGTDLLKDDSKYVFLTKKFQRMTCVNDFSYKRYINAIGNNTNIDVIGHSLDKNDQHIIKPIFDKGSRINIYYYNNRDLEGKIANLMKIFGGDTLEDWIYTRKICFKELRDF